MLKYENSVIYKLKHNEDYDDTNIYVGSTTNFKNRKYAHKTHCNNEKDEKHNYSIYQYIRANGGWDNWVMIPIEQYSCNDKKELEIKERHYIDLFKSKLNKVIPTRTSKEYYIDNKEKIAKRDKEYLKNNKEKKYKKQKEWYEANKENVYNRKKIYCKNNKEKIAEQLAKWRENNKEKSKEYYENIKEKIKEKVICDHCGCEVRKYGLNRHQKTKKCIALQEDNVAR